MASGHSALNLANNINKSIYSRLSIVMAIDSCDIRHVFRNSTELSVSYDGEDWYVASRGPSDHEAIGNVAGAGRRGTTPAIGKVS